MLFGGCTKIGPREANEDSFFARSFAEVGRLAGDIDTFLLVSDGMGGYQGGDIASGLVVRSAQHYLDNVLRIAQTNQIAFNPSMALQEIVRNAHDAIVLETEARGNHSMGATFVGAFLSPTHAWIGHVGDSRAYLWRAGTVLQITQDHSRVGRMLSQNLITEQEAQNHPDRHRIERAVGFSNHEVEITEVDLLPGDGLVLCSDGVYTALDVREMGKCLARATNAESAANVIVKRALRNGSDDNATAVVAFDVVPGAQAMRPRVRQRAGSTTKTMRIPVANANRADGGPIDGATATSMQGTPVTPSQADDYHGTRGRDLLPRIIVGAILIALLVVGVVLITTQVVGKASKVGGPGAGTPESAVMENEGSKTSEETSNEGKSQSEDTNLPQTHDTKDVVAGMRSYTVGEGAVLRYVDAQGLAHRFSEGLTPGLDITIGKETTVAAHTEPDTFGRDNYSYRQLSDDYVQDLLRDCDRCRQGASAYTSALSNMVESEEYANMIKALSQKSAPELQDSLVHVAVSEEDLVQTDEEGSSEVGDSDGTQYAAEPDNMRR